VFSVSLPWDRAFGTTVGPLREKWRTSFGSVLTWFTEPKPESSADRFAVRLSIKAGVESKTDWVPQVESGLGTGRHIEGIKDSEVALLVARIVNLANDGAF